MKKVITSIGRTRTRLEKSLKVLDALEKLAAKKPAPPPRLMALRRGGTPDGEPSGGGASERDRVVDQLIGLLHSEGVNSPGIGPSSTYGGPLIGFSAGRMQAYCQTCRGWFYCPNLAQQPRTISVNQMATKILAAHGHPR